MMGGDDASDLALARGGDAAAFCRLVERHQTGVRIFAASRCGDGDLVEEAVQRAFIAAWRSLDRYDGRGPWDAWLKGIALNHLRKVIGERARRPGAGLDALLAREDAPRLDDAPADDRLDLLRRCLGRLGAAARELVDLRYREGIPLDDLAARSGIAPGTLAVRLHRLRRSLRACIEGGGP
jgi:RNA polymerase sigma-70 factor (ECF subfamily)